MRTFISTIVFGFLFICFAWYLWAVLLQVAWLIVVLLFIGVLIIMRLCELTKS